MEFAVGDTLKFSERGLVVWCENIHSARAEKCRQWRWKVVGFSEKPECKSGDDWVKCLRLRRLDIKTRKVASWSPEYFEKEGDHGSKAG